MVLKKKGRKKSSKKSGAKKETPPSALLLDPIVPEIIPPPPLPFETLVGILAENPMTDKDIDGIHVTSYVSKKLTAQEIRDLHFVFDIFDYDKDGYINEDEFIKALKCLSMPCTYEQARRVFHRAAKASYHDHAVKEETDKPPDTATSDVVREHKHSVFKGLSVNQFLEVIISRQGESYDYQEELAEAYKCFDINDTGITVDSLAALARSVGFELSSKACHEMISLADRDGDGLVTEPEFLKIMLQTNLYSSHLLG